ncbi:MAG: hypothetical protein HAW66_02875 [Shewanella sp.]|nr:hypothetical protein [Shewanella sp.]
MLYKESIKFQRVACVAAAYLLPCIASAEESSTIAVSAVIDGYYQTQNRVLAERQKGFGLGETELAISGNVDDAFFGKITTVIESHDGETEVGLEEAFIQTLALPDGFSLRGGRFISDIGYLNNQHPHSDAFVERPVVYRAFLGSHYFDDGVRLDYLAPTDLYWTMGVEAFAGDKLRAESDEMDYHSIGAYTAYNKLGGDIGLSSSWQLGFSYLRNQNGEQALHEDEHDDHHNDAAELHDEHEEGHHHSAQFTAKNMYGTDFVYKWAPQGNYKYQHLTLSGEYYRLTDLFSAEDVEHALLAEGETHQGWYVSGVYQWNPTWSTGLRYGRVDTSLSEEEVFHKQTLEETEFELAYHHSHSSTIHLQYTFSQNKEARGNEAFLPENDHIVTLQFVMALGAHNAHQF